MPVQFLPLSCPQHLGLSRIGAAASLALALVACGGRDDSAPVITTQPHSVTAAEGSQATASVAATSDGGDMLYQWFNVTGNADIVGALSASVSFSPLSLAADGTQFNVRVANDVGTTTSDNATLSVAERNWSAAADALASGSRQITTVVDSNGHTHLLAITGNNLAAAVEARVKLKHADPTQANGFIAPGGAALQASEALSPVSTSIAAAANGSGHVLAVWHRNGIVGGALYTPGPDAATAGTWTLLPTRINSFTSTSTLDPAVAAVGNDGFEIVWREREAPSGAHDVVARRYTIGTNTLGTSVTIENQNTETAAPRLVSDAAGNVLAAWSQSGVGVLVNRRAAGTAWSTDLTNIDSSGLPLEALRANPAGKAVALTSDRLGTAQASLLDLGASVVLQQSAQVVANAYGSAPDAVVDTANRVHVFGVSVNGDNGSSRLYRWVYTPGSNGGWGGPEGVSAINSNNFFTSGQGVTNPQVAGSDAEGNFIVTWQDRVASGDEPLSHVSARRFHNGLNAWRDIVSVADGNNLTPRVTIDAAGSASVVFGATSGQSMQAASFR